MEREFENDIEKLRNALVAFNTKWCDDHVIKAEELIHTAIYELKERAMK